MTASLFDEVPPIPGRREELCEGAVILRGFALADEPALLAALQEIVAHAPFRHLVTPGGFRMSVAMTNCGTLGWVSDRSGYRYDAIDPDSGHAWPPMPDAFRRLAQEAAANAGFPGFEPDVCLVNRYAPGARLTLHQDRNERGCTAPIVSVSLGLPAVFLFGGVRRSDKTLRVHLAHGDVAVWGGPARMRYHGIAPIKAGHHPSTGANRLNLTFRKAV
jgi:alkylated DNA repair protein (DNA oxidative demethylase)